MLDSALGLQFCHRHALGILEPVVTAANRRSAGKQHTLMASVGACSVNTPMTCWNLVICTMTNAFLRPPPVSHVTTGALEARQDEEDLRQWRRPLQRADIAERRWTVRAP